MKVVTDETIQELPIKIHRYNTFFKRFRGLMFRYKPIEKEGILLIPCNSIHMFFMFFPIDAVFLDDRQRIVALKENVKPWTMVFPVKNAQSTLELPAGTISKYSIKEGNLITI